MTVRHVVPIIKVSDIESAIEFYCAGIGFAKDFEYSAAVKGPHYAGLSLDGNQLHLSMRFGSPIQNAGQPDG